MLNISVSFFNISSKFVQTFVPSVNKLLIAQCIKSFCPQKKNEEQHAVRYGTTSTVTSPI